MTKPILTIEALNEREAKLAAWRGERHRFGSLYRLPEPAERLFTSAKVSGQCLTHITRHISVNSERTANGWKFRHLTFTGWCGTQMSNARTVPVDGEMFGCHACISRGAHFVQDTFNLIPSTGCEASEGKRRGRRKTPSTTERTETT